MESDDERILTRLDPGKLAGDAIDDYAEQLWRALTARMEGDSCPLHSATRAPTPSRAADTHAWAREE